MKKIIALSSILLGIVFLTGCSLQPLKKTQPTASAPIMEQPIATTTPQIDETADWKTYTNKKYGFEMKYPKEAIVSTNEKAIGTRGIVYIGSRDKSIDHGVTYDVEYGITFQDLGSAKNMSAENWYLQYYQSEKQYAAKADMPMFLSASGKNVKLNGYDAYETSDFNSDSSLINFYIAHNGIIYRISYRGEIVQNVPKWPEFEKIINQMLSTFKFTK